MLVPAGPSTRAHASQGAPGYLRRDAGRVESLGLGDPAPLPRASAVIRERLQPSSSPSSPGHRRDAHRRSRSSGAATSPSRVRRSSTSATERACSTPGGDHDLGEQVRVAGDDRLGRARRAPRRGRARPGPRGRSGRRAARSPRREARRRSRGPPARAGIPSGMSSVRHSASRPSRSDDPVDDLGGHPPEGGQLAARDREHPRRGLVELGLAGDVDRLLRVAGRDQGPHARVGAGQVVDAETRCRSRRSARRAGTRRRRRSGARCRCRPRSRCRWCPTSTRPYQGRAKIVRSPPAGTMQAAVPMSRSSVESVTWVPRLGRILGISSSVSSSSGRIRSAQTPVALTTLSARTSMRSPDSASRKATPGGPSVVVEDLGHLGAVHHHGAEALRLAEDGQHEAHVVGLAVVEEIGGARLQSAPGPGSARPPPRPRSCGGGRATSSRPPPECSLRWLRPRPIREVAITSYMFSPIPMRRSRRLSPSAGTRNGVG